jgi:hypothetical protein
MHNTPLIQEIDRLLRNGELTQRQIAAHLCVSRGTVSSIANGNRGLYGKDPSENDCPLVPSTPPTRCPKCGYRVYLPCVICQVRQHKQRERLLQILAAQRPKYLAAGASPSNRTNNLTFRRATAQNDRHQERCA